MRILEDYADLGRGGGTLDEREGAARRADDDLRGDFLAAAAARASAAPRRVGVAQRERDLPAPNGVSVAFRALKKNSREYLESLLELQ